MRTLKMALSGSMCVAFAGLAATSAAAGDASCRAASFGWGARNSSSARGRETWRWTTPTARDVINWTSAIRVDATRCNHSSTEPKFAFPGALGRLNWGGFTLPCGAGVFGSVAAAGGTGGSYVT